MLREVIVMANEAKEPRRKGISGSFENPARSVAADVRRRERTGRSFCLLISAATSQLNVWPAQAY